MVRTRAAEDVMLDIPEGSTGRGHGRGQVPLINPLPPPPWAPVSIDDLLATQNELMRVLMHNEANRGVERRSTTGSKT
jgi:hypothetical protein